MSPVGETLNADKSKFVAQTDFDENRKAKSELYYKEGPGSLKSVFGSDSKYWPIEMRNALGFHKFVEFPLQLSLNPAVPKTTPAVNFDENIMSAVGETLNKAQKIYITPTDFFTTQYRQIFKDGQVTFRTSKNARKWLGGPHMGFWLQHLNFALWCATLRNPAGDSCRGPSGRKSAGLRFLSLPRLFHNKANSVRNGWISENKLSARRPELQPNRQQI